MLEHCYYFDQKNYTAQDYRYLRRYIDRMIQYRNSTKGSYNGKKRDEEIRQIDIGKLTERTKDLLCDCIRRHNAEELYHLPNLRSLAARTAGDMSFLWEEQGMKLNVEDFYHNLKELNSEIKRLTDNGQLPDNYLFEIKCIGGFAMSYWNIRDEGLTEDMDSLAEIDDIIKTCIRDIAKKDKLPLDWINDVMLRFYREESFHWHPVEWYFGRDARIKLFVCSREDLLKNKLPMAEAYLEGRNFQDRDAEVDYKDTLNLLKSFKLGYGVNPAFIRVKLSNMGISLAKYPHMFHEIIEKGVECGEEDFTVLSDINKVDRNELSMEEFVRRMQDSFGYTIEDIQEFYGLYLPEFPVFQKAFHQEIF